MGGTAISGTITAESPPTEESSENVENKPLQRKNKMRSPLKDKKNGLRTEKKKVTMDGDDEDLKALKHKIEGTSKETATAKEKISTEDALSRSNTMIIEEAKEQKEKDKISPKETDSSEEKEKEEKKVTAKVTAKPKRQLS